MQRGERSLTFELEIEKAEGHDQFVGTDYNPTYDHT